MNDKIKYIIPAGAKIRPSESGHYNFWYPHSEQEYEAIESFFGEPMRWSGSEEWEAVLVNVSEAEIYKSPIKVVWVEKQIIKDIEGKFYLKKRLEKRGN